MGLLTTCEKPVHGDGGIGLQCDLKSRMRRAESASSGLIFSSSAAGNMQYFGSVNRHLRENSFIGIVVTSGTKVCSFWTHANGLVLGAKL